MSEQLTRKDIEDIVTTCASTAANEFPTTKIKDAVKDGINDVLKTIGVDVDNPKEMQKDFIFIRDVRQGTEKVKYKVLFTFIGVCMAGTLVALWQGFKDSVIK